MPKKYCGSCIFPMPNRGQFNRRRLTELPLHDPHGFECHRK
jgi:hypothetical protein